MSDIASFIQQLMFHNQRMAHVVEGLEAALSAYIEAYGDEYLQELMLDRMEAAVYEAEVVEDEDRRDDAGGGMDPSVEGEAQAVPETDPLDFG